MKKVDKSVPDSTFDPVAVLAEVARRYGVEKLARHLGKSASLLYAKLTESVENKAPSLREALAISDHADDTALLEAWAVHCGGVFIPLPPATASDDDVLDDMIALSESLGRLALELRKSRSDGVIDRREYQRLEASAADIHQKLGMLIASIETQVREVPAKAIRAAA